MRNFLQERLQKNRAPPLVHSWEFWHDRQDRKNVEGKEEKLEGETTSDTKGAYEDRLVKLSDIHDVRSFWAVFNNFDVSVLPLRDSVHLFHKGVKPIWEDARNEKGGSWTFRVAKSSGADFWREVCMMAIGEQLQAAVESERTRFRDDICGVSLGVRFNSVLIQVWNRDGDHEKGVERILQVVLENTPPTLAPREGSYYYKKHSEHAGFKSGATDGQDS